MKKKILATIFVLITVASVFAQSVKSDFVLVEGGTFSMGSSGEYLDEEPVHTVTVSSFYMCDHEVTQKEYYEIMKTNPSFYEGDNRPVERVSWYDAVEYCNKLSIAEGLTPCYNINGKYTTCNFSADGYRLPTEAEWEYAARGGKKSNGYTYSGSNSIEDVAWYGNHISESSYVKIRLPNEIGLYDMSGNVCEWCWDWYGSYSSSSQTDPTGASWGMYRVVRGGCWYGSWNGSSRRCRVASRDNRDPSFAMSCYYGFRVVRSCSNTKMEQTLFQENIKDSKDILVLVEGGTFSMESTSGKSYEKPVHTVTVSIFYMCDHEVTQKRV